MSVVEPPTHSRWIDGWLSVTLLVVAGVVVGHLWMPDLVHLVQDITRVYVAPLLGLAPAEPYW